MSWKHWIAVGLLVLIGIFVLQNTHVVEVRFLFWKLAMSRALVLLAVLAVGLVAGWILGAVTRRPKP